MSETNVTEIKSLEGHPLADEKARADIAALSEEIEQLKGGGGSTGRTPRGDAQIFNVEEAVVEKNLYLNGSNQIISYNGNAVVTLEVNGQAGDVFRFMSFSEKYPNGVNAVRCYSTNEIPAVGVSIVETSPNTATTPTRGAITLSTACKYINIMVWFTQTYDATVFDSDIADFCATLVVNKNQGGQPTEYLSYYIESESDPGESLSQWQDKTIVWLGTSIPEGRDTAIGSEGFGLTYPGLVGKLLGATVVNLALGSSMCRANVRTGDYVGGNAYNISRALTQTSAEKETLIANWDSIRTNFSNPDAMTTLSDAEKETIRASSFEARLLPYLDGTNPMPDLFVIDHGNNDYKYKLEDDSTDIGLEPTQENITGGKLAADTYMTDNEAANLEAVFGDLSKIDNYNAFVASLNRNCYIGAVNFICTLILKYNPRARIVFVGQYDNWGKPGLTDAQNELADSWAFPIVRLWEKLGWRNHRIPGTANYWGDNRANDLKQSEVWLKDNVHPHSDTTGGAIVAIAKAIEYELRNVWGNSN